MAMMCGLKGCQAKAGLCGHEKMMLGLGVVVALAFAGWALGLV